MRIKFPLVTLNVEEYNSSNKDYVFLLHGFTGSSKDWQEIIPRITNCYNIISVDLIGHGKSDSPENKSYYTTEAIIEQIHQTILYFTNSPVIIAGYSMGGRAALSFAAKYPQLIKGLILESAGAGISEEQLRNERLEQDQKLAEFIEVNTIGEFVEYWINISLFESQKNLSAEKQENIKGLKLKNSKTGLANCLKGFSTGIMPPLFNSLKDITAKTLLISGSLDLKYTALNKDLARCFPNSEHIIIKNAGHNVHLEQPVQFADVINDYLKSL